MKKVIHKQRPSNTKALVSLVVPFTELGIAVLLHTALHSPISYILSQLLLGIFFFQCFILLHECGHKSFFKSKWANQGFGHVMGFLSLIPFTSWVEIHNLHHKWTGFRDKDPTTEGTVNPKFSSFTKALVNISWRLYIPLFTLGYRFGNYWNLEKMKRHLKSKNIRRIRLNMIVQLLLYAGIIVLVNKTLFFYVLPAYILSLIISDLVILSQHSHIDIPIAGNIPVRPIRYSDQVIYTRSITFPKFIAHYFLFNFNLHEAHHQHPSLPAYYLGSAIIDKSNAPGFIEYLKRYKSLSGMNFVFNTKDKLKTP